MTTAAVVVLSSLTACGTRGSAPLMTLALPKAEYLNPAWLRDGTILANVTPADDDTGRIPLRVVSIAPGQPAASHDVVLPQPSPCVDTDYVINEPTADDRVTMRAQCLTGHLPDAIRTRAVVADPRRPAAVTTLAPLPELNPLAVSWRPGLHDGMVGTTAGDCAGLSDLGSHGVESAAAPVTLDGHRWRLDEPLEREMADPSSSCQGLGTAVPGTYSADGRTVMFFASAAAASRSGRAKDHAPTTLFAARATSNGQLFDPSTVRAIVDDVTDPVGMSAAPTGDLIAVAATINGRRGLWRIDTRTDDKRLLAGGEFTSPSISPDGRRVVVVNRADPAADTTTLVVYCLVGPCRTSSPRTAA